MKNKAFISAVLILAVLSLGALAGIVLFTRDESVDAAELKLVSELVKTHYHAGELTLQRDIKIKT